MVTYYEIEEIQFFETQTLLKEPSSMKFFWKTKEAKRKYFFYILTSNYWKINHNQT